MENRRKEIALEIIAAMKERGLNKKQLAALMKRNPSEVTRWVSGKHNFTVSLLEELSEVLDTPISGVRPTDLVCGYGQVRSEHILRDSACAGLYVPLSQAGLERISRLAARKNTSIEALACEILEREGSSADSLAEFVGILPAEFPSAEEIRCSRKSLVRPVEL